MHHYSRSGSENDLCEAKKDVQTTKVHLYARREASGNLQVVAFERLTMQTRPMSADRQTTGDKFEFTNVLQFDQQQYVELNGVTIGKSRPVLIIGFALAGLLMLFWSYTLLLGIIVLAVTGIMVFAPHKLRGTDAWHYRVRPLYQQEIVYGVSDQGLRFETQGAEAEIVWVKKIVWENCDDLLRISPVNFPSCWFRISELKQSGVHDKVMDKCRRCGKQFKNE